MLKNEVLGDYLDLKSSNRRTQKMA